MKPNIYPVYQDPGGRAALLPVIQQLQADAAVDVVSGGKVDFLLAGTSMDGYEKTEIDKYRGCVPTLSVLDFWSNYRVRFADKLGNLAYLPDTIAVMDDLAVKEMVEEGFPPERLVVTGQPAFDCLGDKKRDFTYARERATRLYYGCREGRKTIVFASQPHARQPYTIGYTEHTVLRLLIDALPDNADLIIRPHPRENIADLMQYMEIPRITVQRKEMVHELLMSADLVVGMNTELLVEACYLGCIVLSIQPGLIGRDCLPTNRSGHSWALYDHTRLAGTLTTLLEDKDARRYMRQQANGLIAPEKAAPKVARLIYERLGIVCPA